MQVLGCSVGLGGAQARTLVARARLRQEETQSLPRTETLDEVSWRTFFRKDRDRSSYLIRLRQAPPTTTEPTSIRNLHDAVLRGKPRCVRVSPDETYHVISGLH